MDQTSRHPDGTILVSGDHNKEEDKSEEKANNKDYNEGKYKKASGCHLVLCFLEEIRLTSPHVLGGHVQLIIDLHTRG